MAKDAFDRWWKWAEKPMSSDLTIPAHLHDAVMQLPPKQTARPRGRQRRSPPGRSGRSAMMVSHRGH
jgi:hypothetical protein